MLIFSGFHAITLMLSPCARDFCRLCCFRFFRLSPAAVLFFALAARHEIRDTAAHDANISASSSPAADTIKTPPAARRHDLCFAAASCLPQHFE